MVEVLPTSASSDVQAEIRVNDYSKEHSLCIQRLNPLDWYILRKLDFIHVHFNIYVGWP